MNKFFTLEISISVESEEIATGVLLPWLQQFGQVSSISCDTPEGDEIPSAKFELMTARPQAVYGTIEKVYREYDDNLKGIYFYTTIIEITFCPENANAQDILGLVNILAYNSCLERIEQNHFINEMGRSIVDLQAQANHQTRVLKNVFNGINRLSQEVLGEDLFAVDLKYVDPNKETEEQPTITPEKKQWLH